MGLFDRFFSKKSDQPPVQAEQASSKKPTASDYEGPPISKAVEWAKLHPTELLKELDEKSKIRIAHIISDGIQNKRGLPGISRDIRKEFPSIEKSVADNVVLTETNNALSEAAMQRMKTMGVDGKEWITCPTPCDICFQNKNAGVIPIGQPFPSGHMRTPAHEGCRCAIAPARLKIEK